MNDFVNGLPELVKVIGALWGLIMFANAIFQLWEHATRKGKSEELRVKLALLESEVKTNREINEQALRSQTELLGIQIGGIDRRLTHVLDLLLSEEQRHLLNSRKE